MPNEAHFRQSESLYLNPERKVAILDFGKNYVRDSFTLVNSDNFALVVQAFLDAQNHLDSSNSFEDVTAQEYLTTIKRVLMDDDRAFDKFTASEILASIEKLYSFYRSFLRVAVMERNEGSLMPQEFRRIDNHFNELIRNFYRAVEEKLQGFANNVYRQVNAGTNAAVLTQKHTWALPEGYEALAPVSFIDRIALHPPMMMNTKSNKREGRFAPTAVNPVTKFARQPGRWFCYPAKIGTSLAFIYFHEDYMVSGLALANLFELAKPNEVNGKKPDEILLFGLDETADGGCHYFHDEENDIWVGEVPYNDKTTYFGYMKKMCLTLHNLHQIHHDKLPIHGSMVNIKFTNGKEKSVVFFGDSGAGKSESIEALQEVADEKIISIETVFDDMGSFTLGADGHVYAQGTETGAFVRLDDLSSAVAFNNMDRGVYLNPDNKNARVIIPANTYDRVITHHHIDMWVYANNYDDKVGIHRFEDEASAKKTFIEGKRKALGTTDEVGMSTTFFANPFGPVQEEAKTRPIIEKMFTSLFNDGVYVGEIYTRLGYDKSKDALHQSATSLLDELMNN